VGVAKKLLELAAKAAREAEGAAARKNYAVKPRQAKPAVSKLDMTEAARMERARQMGFDVDRPLYVSVLENTPQFRSQGIFGGHKGVSGVSLTDNPRMASRYLDRFGEHDYKQKPFSKQMMKVFIRPGNVREYQEPIKSSTKTGFPLPENYAWPEIMQGVDTAVFPDALSARGGVKHVSPDSPRAIQGREFVLRDPSRIRSFSAAFDPEHAESADLMKARGGLAVKPVWDKKRPKELGEPGVLSVKRKSAAKRRAKAAGRPYPNLVDNLAAARKKGK
jgi:hypothetical protein